MDPSQAPQDYPAEMYEWNGAVLVAISGVGILFVIMVTTLRVYGRLFLLERRAMGLEDHLMVAAAVFGVGFMSAMITAFTKGGGGYHIAILPLDKLKVFLICSYVGGPLFSLTLGLIKMSMLALYWRVSRPASTFRMVLLFCGVFLVLMTIALTVAPPFFCKPLRKAWDPSVVGGHCIEANPFWFAQAVFMITTDLVIYLLPLRVIWQIQLPYRQKLSLCFLFGLGGLACIAGIVKLIFFAQVLSSKDPSFDGRNSLLWGTIELWAAVVAGSGPSLRIVVRKFLGPILGSSMGSATRPSGVNVSDHHKRSQRSHSENYALQSIQRKGGASETMVSVSHLNPLNESMERIIPDGNILKTTEVKQEVETQSEHSSRC